MWWRTWCDNVKFYETSDEERDVTTRCISIMWHYLIDWRNLCFFYWIFFFNILPCCLLLFKQMNFFKIKKFVRLQDFSNLHWSRNFISNEFFLEFQDNALPGKIRLVRALIQILSCPIGTSKSSLILENDFCLILHSWDTKPQSHQFSNLISVLKHRACKW